MKQKIVTNNNPYWETLAQEQLIEGPYKPDNNSVRKIRMRRRRVLRDFFEFLVMAVIFAGLGISFVILLQLWAISGA